MSNAMLRDAVMCSLCLSEALRQSLAKINRYIVYKGLNGGEKPKATMCNEDEIILYYKGKSLEIEAAIDYMESQGCVDIEDFHY